MGDKYFTMAQNQKAMASPANEATLLETGSSTTTVPWKSIARSPAVGAIAVCHFVYNWSQLNLISWLPTYFHDVVGLSATDLSASALPYLAMSLATNLSGLIADRLLQRGLPLLQVRKIMTTVGFISPALFLGCSAYHPPPTVAVILMVMALSSSTSAVAGFLSNHLDLSEKHAATLLGLTNTGATLAGIIGVNLTARLLAEGYGWGHVFLLSSTLYVAGTVVYNIFASAQRTFD